MIVNLKNPLYIIVYAAVVSAVFTAAIMALQVATADQVKRNEALRGERALVEVFGLGDVEALSAEEITNLVKRRIVQKVMLEDPDTGWTCRLIQAYDTDSTSQEDRREEDLIGVGFPISGMGFWAQISGLLALSPDYSEVMGVVFLDQRETPGLGGRIMEKEWRENFKKLNVSPPRKEAKFIYIGGGKADSPSDPRYGRCVDAITGATQTSLAVDRFINNCLECFHRAVAAGPGPAKEKE